MYRALVCFVEHDGRVLGEISIGDAFVQQDAVRHVLDARISQRAILEADLEAHLSAHLTAPLQGYSLGYTLRCQAPSMQL